MDVAVLPSLYSDQFGKLVFHSAYLTGFVIFGRIVETLRLILE